MKVAVCTPSAGHPKLGYVRCLAGLLLYPRDFEILHLTEERSNISSNRSRLAAEALKQGADGVLWLDDDMAFPTNTLDHLLSHGADIAGCNYAIRRPPHGPTARRMGMDGIESVYPDPARKDLEEVERIGFGVCYTSAKALEAVGQPYFCETVSDGHIVSEDYHFCDRARSAGFPIWLDHQLSMHIGHIGERTYTAADIIADKPRWEMATK